MFRHKTPLLCNLFRYPFSLNRLAKNARAMVERSGIFYSTSNHNLARILYLWTVTVYTLYSTSNHNKHSHYLDALKIVYTLYSTSNHNYSTHSFFCILIVYTLYSTSNHNTSANGCRMVGTVYTLYSTSNHNLFKLMTSERNCLYPIFYIKPQPRKGTPR